MYPSKLFWAVLRHLPEPHKTEFLEMAIERQEAEEKKSLQKLLNLLNNSVIAKKTGRYAMGVGDDELPPELLKRIEEFEPPSEVTDEEDVD